jgi:hypothetical protein
MKIVIQLNPVDADGLGGDLLLEQGAHRSLSNPCKFTLRNSFDPAVVAPPDFDNSQWALKYTDLLRDHGIRAQRVWIKNDATSGMTPMYASVVSHVNEAMALLAAADAVAEDDSSSRGKQFLSVLSQPEEQEDGTWLGKAAFTYVSGPKKDKKYRVDVRLDKEGRLSVKDGQLLVEPIAAEDDDLVGGEDVGAVQEDVDTEE